MKTAAIYCRVSTEKQEQEGTSLQTQLEACLKYCHDKGYEVACRFSEAYSGLTLERPKLNELRELERAKVIDVIVVYSIDRYSRDPVHGVILMQELEKHGVSLEAATETVDNSEIGKLVFYIKGYAAKLDAARRRDATGRGKAHLVSKGILPTGTGKGLFGYRWDQKSKKRIPIEAEVKVVEKIFEMCASGMSRFQIAKTLNEHGILTKAHKNKRGILTNWHPLTIQRLVTNPAYIGLTYYYQTRGSRKTDLVSQDKSKWVVLKDVTPAIISNELFERAQERLRQQKEARHSVDTRHYLLRGHVYCSNCGSPLIGTCLNRKYLYYHCRGNYPTAARKAICKTKYIRAEMLETLVWDKVKAIISNRDVVLAELRKQAEMARAQSNITSLDKEIKVIERRLKDYPLQEKRLINAIKTAQFTEDYILDEINRVKAERIADTTRLDELKQAKIHLANLATAEAKLGEFYNIVKERIEHCSDEDKRLAFEALALKVKATSETVEITGVIPVEITAMQSSEALLTIEQTSA